jgi:hypothetical protein
MPPRLPAGFVPPIPTLPGILYGIELTLFAADTSYFFEIQRATDAIGTGAVTIASGIPGGQKVYVDVVANNISYWYRIRHIYSGATPSPWTCWLGGITGRVMSQEPLALDPVAPILSAVPVRGSSTGTVTVTVTDPQCRVVLVEFETIDNGVSSGWITDSTVPYSAVVNLHAVASNVVNYRVTGYDRDGILRILAQDSFRFDPLGTTAFPPAALITPLTRSGTSGSMLYSDLVEAAQTSPTISDRRSVSQRRLRCSVVMPPPSPKTSASHGTQEVIKKFGTLLLTF